MRGALSAGGASMKKMHGNEHILIATTATRPLGRNMGSNMPAHARRFPLPQASNVEVVQKPYSSCDVLRIQKDADWMPTRRFAPPR